MEVIPAIDLLGDEAVRLQQGDYERVDRSTASPWSSPRASPARAPRWIHVVDLDGARAGRVRPDVVARARRARPRRCRCRRRAASARSPTREALLDAGADRVVVGTAACGGSLDEFVDALGERLVVALDVRDGVVRTRGWTETTRLDARRRDRALRRGRRAAAALHRDRPRRDARRPRRRARRATSSERSGAARARRRRHPRRRRPRQRSSAPARRARSSAARSSKGESPSAPAELCH